MAKKNSNLHAAKNAKNDEFYTQLADIEAEIKINERAIRDRLSHHSMLSRVMAEALNEEERKIIWAKYAEKYPWWRIEKIMYKSISSCKRIEDAGMKKLCYVWDKKKEMR